MHTINDRLRISREKAKISQKDMAIFCAVSLKSIGNYEKAGRKVDANIILVYAEKCREDASYLLTGEIPISVITDNKKEYIANSQSFAGGADASQSGDSAMHGNFIGEPKEYHFHNQLNEKLYEDLTQQYKKTIEILEQQLVEKTQRIKELETKRENKN